MLVIKINQDVAVHAVRRQQNQHNEIRNQQRQIKPVGVIQALKSFIQKVLAHVLPDALRGEPSGMHQVKIERRYDQGFRRSYSTGFDYRLEVKPLQVKRLK